MQRIRVSDNRRYLITEDGHPFFWLADTAWQLFHYLTREEIIEYLDNRQRHGFTVIQAVVLAEFDGLRRPNAYGVVPFVEFDPRRPVEGYFEHVDFAIRAAEARGLYVGLLPTWGDKLTPDWGAGPVVFDVETAGAYGRWIGKRYRDASNVIWVLGGDRPPVRDADDWRPIWRALAAGIRAEAGDGCLMTYHTWGHPDGTAVLHDEDWLDFHMLQSGHVLRDTPNWDSITNLLALTPPKPALDSEPNYEDHAIDPYLRTWQPSFGCYTDYDVRKQAYRAVFAGACGHTYGHHSVWQFYALERQPVNFPQCLWRQAIDRPGAAQLHHLKRLMLARPYLSRIPDQGILRSEAGTRGTHVRATRDSDGTYALIYIPQSGWSIEVNLGWLRSGAGQAWWVDPRNGVCIEAGRVSGEYARFTTLDHGPDWVLLIDDASAERLPPGEIGKRNQFGEYR